MKKFCLLVFLLITTSNNVFSAGTSSSDTKSSYDQAVKFIKAAKKLEEKGKIEKANKRYAKAQKLLIKSNKTKPLQADTLNYLGFTTRKLGDFESGEKYYLLGLEIDPSHVGINEYLGELYVATNRYDLANKRLKVLEKCDCQEYKQLFEIISGTKKTKY